ncbi:septum formation inhibitor [Lachnoclostridium sp. An169]|uniref:septum site-determining protein MinC n=1 Tax=Lachnoclostridium sp. An169 TaxID=1965569 RepID=UPI000B37CBC1|nr:septum site-determining protein MinC [Lachnoclostridium sp. An169]OUP83082.1 septum formation inhibitor [Lachnoclostridium sp. An169]
MDRLVTIRSSRYGMDIQLDPDVPFLELTEALNRKFSDSSKFFKGARMAVSFSGRTLSRTEEARILKIISDTTDIEVVCIIEKNEKNELMYKSVVEQTLSNIQKKEGQFYRGTLRRRQILESDSSIVILGDVEPGARVAAKGNIVIVGALYGSVHAGASGDRNAFIVALSMQPKQLMIGDIEAKRQIIYQESLNISGPKIAVIDGKRIYLDPLVD